VDVSIFCIVPQVGSISPRSMRPMVDGDTSANRASSLRVVPPSERIFLTTAAASMPATSIRDCVSAIISRVGALCYACVRPCSPRHEPTRPGRLAAGGHIVARNLPLFDHLVENPSALLCGAMTWPYNPDMQLTSRLDRRKLAAES